MPDARLERTRAAYGVSLVRPVVAGEVPHDWFYDIEHDEYVCRRCGERTQVHGAAPLVCRKES